MWSPGRFAQDQTISRNVDDVTTVSYNSKISSSPWSDALGIFGLVLVNGWRPDVVSYNSSITACTKGLQWTRALSLLNELLLGRLSTTVITYGASISACEKVSQWQTALSLFFEAESKNQMNIILCNATISSLEKGHQWQRALHLFSQLFVKALRPNGDHLECFDQCIRKERRMATCACHIGKHASHAISGRCHNIECRN